MNEVFYLGNYRFSENDENKIYKPQDFVENYYYIFKVEIVDKNKLKILDILHDTIRIPNIAPESILTYKTDFDLDGDYMFQIENLSAPETTCKFMSRPTQMYLYKPFEDTKIVCLKTLETIKENIIKSSKILNEIEQPVYCES